MKSGEWVFHNIQKALRARNEAGVNEQEATEKLRRALLDARMMEIPLDQLVNETGLSRREIYDLLME